MSEINQEKVERALKNFEAVVRDRQKNPGSKISFREEFLSAEEGYKRKLYEKAGLGVKNQDLQERSDTVREKYLTAVDLEENNLLDWRDRLYIKEKMKEKESEELIYQIYKEPGSNDEDLFNECRNLWGSRFPILSWTFFLKDMEKYPPVRPKNLKKRLGYLGADTKCMNSCTWENYQRFIGILKEVQELLNEREIFEPKAELIDAHSFVSITPSD